MERYSTLTGRKVGLERLSEDERVFLREVLEFYNTNPDWSEFSSFWVDKGQHLWKGLPREKVVISDIWKICQDLETRLGCRQGKVAFPDYRDFLIDVIETRFPSRYRFCQELGIDEGFLSKVLNGRKDFSLATLSQILESLGLVLLIGDKQTYVQKQDMSLHGVAD